MKQQVCQGERKIDQKKGVAYATLSYAIWGVLPIYWKAMAPMDPIVIMFYRMLMACIFVGVLARVIYKPAEILAPLKNRRAIPFFFLSGALISLNWGIYIWAVNSGHVIQTSMGYYINPLITVLFGVLFFKERLNCYKLAAILIAGIGVVVILIGYGEFPAVAFSLAVTFACYGAIKKKLNANSILALLYETAFLTPVALVVIYMIETGNGSGLLDAGTPTHYVLVAFAGIVTAVPLILFAAAANRVDLTTIGFIQYISPTITLFLGIFAFHETFDRIRLIAFLFIWAGLAVYVFSELRSQSKEKVDECL